MAIYQFYRLSAAGEILAAPDYCDCPVDGVAHVIAASLVGDHAAVMGGNSLGGSGYLGTLNGRGAERAHVPRSLRVEPTIL
jgi:hypothetical protein